MEARLIERVTRNHFISVLANEIELLSIWAQVWARFPSNLQSRVGGGGEVDRRSDEKWWGWIQPKITLSYFETILRQNLLFSVAVLISMLDVSCDSVSSYIYFNLRRSIKQDNLIISNNERKTCKNRRFWQKKLGVCWLVRWRDMTEVRAINAQTRLLKRIVFKLVFAYF